MRVYKLMIDDVENSQGKWGRIPSIPDGYYWTMTNSGSAWKVMEFSRGKWHSCGYDVPLTDSPSIIIGPRLEPPFLYEITGTEE